MLLEIPVLLLVLGFTAVPAGLQLPNAEDVAAGFSVFPSGLHGPDMLANVLGYVPVGVVLGGRGAWRALGIATGVSLFAEIVQLFSVGRAPSFLDLLMNVGGSAMGIALSHKWKPQSVSLGISQRNALVAAAMALAYLGFGAWMTPRLFEKSVATFLKAHSVSRVTVNAAGITSPGRLEAHWDFDEQHSNVVGDSSGNSLNGALVGGATLVAGVSGNAVRLNGLNQYVDFGNPVELRLTGSMTLSARFNPSSFPVDDAAIVSSLSKRELGYQLDTTVDRGRRTIGFKLADASGRLMARYGRTPLRTDTWYHVAGVYDARRQALDVYLNGKQDNGCLLGAVTASQHISGTQVYVGRRAEMAGFGFAGSIDDVKIYSRALSPGEIEAQTTSGTASEALPLEASVPDEPTAKSDKSEATCVVPRVPDASTAGVAVIYGLLVAFAAFGLGPTVANRMSCLAFSVAAGFLLLLPPSSALTAIYGWATPMLTLAGGASVVASLRTPDA
jgi:VanZ family protein